MCKPWTRFLLSLLFGRDMRHIIDRLSCQVVPFLLHLNIKEHLIIECYLRISETQHVTVFQFNSFSCLGVTEVKLKKCIILTWYILNYCIYSYLCIVSCPVLDDSDQIHNKNHWKEYVLLFTVSKDSNISWDNISYPSG